MKVFGFDIETNGLDLPFDESKVKFGNTKDPVKREIKILQAKKAWEEKKTQALNALTGEILLICIGRAGHFIDCYGNEAGLLKKAWDCIGPILDRGERLVGHNCFGFDLPFMIRRSYYHGVHVPTGIFNHQFRRWNDGFVDTMKRWTLADYQAYIGLDELDRFFGGPGVPSGKKFNELWEKDQQAAIEYCHGDIEAALRCAASMGVSEL